MTDPVAMRYRVEFTLHSTVQIFTYLGHLGLRGRCDGRVGGVLQRRTIRGGLRVRRLLLLLAPLSQIAVIV